jgi:hypothetical protein
MLETLPEQTTTLFLGLEHPEKDVRILALKRLGEILSEDKPDLDKFQFVGTSLIRRLQGSPREIRLVLKLKHLMTICEPQELLSSSLNLVACSGESEVRLRAIHLSLEIITRHPDLITNVVEETLLGSVLLLQVGIFDVERKEQSFANEHNTHQVSLGFNQKNR